MTRTIAVLTTGRSDYGICLPVMRAIQESPDLDLRVLVTGTHLSPEYGFSVTEIERDGFSIQDRVEILLSSDSPEGIAKSGGLAAIGFSQVFSRFRPDVLVAVGDRFEAHAAVSAATPFRIPIAHIHGGEITQGAIDEIYRHSISKMSHIHFASTQAYANRIAQMGESEDRIFVTGAPGLDNLKSLQIPTKDLVERETGVDLSQPTLLCTYHPVTREEDSGESELNGMLSAIRHLELPVVFTYPNADASGRRMISRVKEFVDSCPAATLIVNASQSNYLGLMQYTGAMVGNSSSGIIEAASLGLPVVNIGRRQEGRVRAKNVIDVDGSEQSVANGITKALSRAFRISLIGLVNPYGAGEAGVRIARVLAGIPLGTELQEKAFVDVEPRKPTPSTEGTSCES